jgi:hypothetical protein
MEDRADAWRGGKVTSGWGSCCPSRVEDGAKEGPFSLLPRERWVLLKPSIRAGFLLFLAAPRPGTDSTINSRKGNWKECSRKRACGRQAGRQQDWTPPGHSPGLSFLPPQLLTPSCHLQSNERTAGPEAALLGLVGPKNTHRWGHRPRPQPLTLRPRHCDACREFPRSLRI